MRSINLVSLLWIVIVAIFTVSCNAISGANLETLPQHDSRETTMNDNRFFRAIPAEDEERAVDFSKILQKWSRPNIIDADAVDEYFSKGTLELMKKNKQVKNDVFGEWDRNTIIQIERSIGTETLKDKPFRAMFASYVQQRIATQNDKDFDGLFTKSMLELMTGNAQLKQTVFKRWNGMSLKQIKLKIGDNLKDKRFAKMMEEYEQKYIIKGYKYPRKPPPTFRLRAGGE